MPVLSIEHAESLEKLKSICHTSLVKKDGRRFYLGEVSDLATNTTYATGEDITEEGAAIKAVKAAMGADQPQTIAQIVAERDSLKAELKARNAPSESIESSTQVSPELQDQNPAPPPAESPIPEALMEMDKDALVVYAGVNNLKADKRNGVKKLRQQIADQLAA